MPRPTVRVRACASRSSRAVRSAGLALLASVVAWACVAGCGGDDPPKKANATDSGTVEPIPTSTGTTPTTPFTQGDASSPPITAGDAGPVPGNCAAGALCLDVSSVRPNGKPLAGRLAVMWAQLVREGENPIAELGYDVPFAGTETMVQIPLGSITPPTDRNMICQRDCPDESSCPCLTDPRVGVGYVVVIHDQNVNGKADIGATAVDSEPFIGVGLVGIAYSAKAFKPVPNVEYNYDTTFPMLFPESIELGVAAHALVPSMLPGFDAMGTLAGTAHFKLPVCDTLDKNTCAPSWPSYP